MKYISVLTHSSQVDYTKKYDAPKPIDASDLSNPTKHYDCVQDDSEIPLVDFRGAFPSGLLDNVLSAIENAENTYRPFEKSPFLSSKIIRLNQDRQIMLSEEGNGTYIVAYNDEYLYAGHLWQYPGFAEWRTATPVAAASTEAPAPDSFRASEVMPEPEEDFLR